MIETPHGPRPADEDEAKALASARSLYRQPSQVSVSRLRELADRWDHQHASDCFHEYGECTCEVGPYVAALRDVIGER